MSFHDTPSWQRGAYHDTLQPGIHAYCIGKVEDREVRNGVRICDINALTGAESDNLQVILSAPRRTNLY